MPNRNIIIYDRNSNQLQVNGYHALVPPGVRVAGLDERWTIKGETLTGYDRDVYCEMDCFGERETRSYLGTIVSSDANKIINLPTLKEHNASGVTGCLKNLAYGTFNNVDRTHANTKTYTDPVIAIMCTAGPIRSKAVLNIMDGIRAVYHSGPFAWNPEFVWEAKTLLFGTDPVAVDRIELEIVEKKRRDVGVPSLVGSESRASRQHRRDAANRAQEPVLPRAGTHQDRLGARARHVGSGSDRSPARCKSVMDQPGLSMDDQDHELGDAARGERPSRRHVGRAHEGSRGTDLEGGAARIRSLEPRAPCGRSLRDLS